MTDPTARRLAAALDSPEEADRAGRRIFLAILWVSVAIGLFAHLTEPTSTARIAVAVIAALVLGAWLHGIHQVQRWSHHVSTSKTTVMLFGLYGVLAALIIVDPAYLIVLFGAYSLTFGFVVDVRLAAGLSFIVTLIWIGGWLLHDLPRGAIVTPILVWTTLVVIAGVLDRVTQQSAERRELLAEVHETRAQLAEAERERGVLAERQRVSAEIHDTIAQGFTSIVLLSQGMRARASELADEGLGEGLELVEQTARDNLAATRRLVQDLRPVELDADSLLDTITQVAAKHESSTGVSVQVVVHGEVRPLGGQLDVALLRGTQEALSNAAKHADASSVVIELVYGDEAIALSVTDDGDGFDPQTAPRAVGGLTGGDGIRLLGERLAAVGGKASIISEPGTGTTVQLEAPYGDSQ